MSASTGSLRSARPGERPVAPPGWPAEVRPAGAPDWERTATAWLFDLCPPEFRTWSVLRRHPVVLARFAALAVEARQHAADRGLAEVRVALRDVVAPQVVAESVDAWQAEQARLVGLGRAVALVEQALRGRRFVPRL